MMLAIAEQYEAGPSSENVEHYTQYRSVIDNLQASLEQREVEIEASQRFLLDHTRNLIQQANIQIQEYESGLSPEVMEIYTQGSIHEKYNPGGNYLSIWHHGKVVAERPDSSRVETRYDPDTGLISGVEIHSQTGETKELTYYYQGKPAYRTTHSHERPDCYHYVRTENWFGVHDVYETTTIICKDGWGRVKTERRYIDGNLVKEVNHPVD